MSDHEVTSGCLSVVEGSGHLIITTRQLGSFRKGPGQILVAVLAVTFPFLLLVACLFGGNLTAIGRKIAHGWKPFNLACFQHDR